VRQSLPAFATKHSLLFPLFLPFKQDGDPFYCRGLLQERLFQQECGELPSADQLQRLFKLLEKKGKFNHVCFWQSLLA
jgi:hypothetical protein